MYTLVEVLFIILLDGEIKAESSNTYVLGYLTLYVQMDYLIQIDKIKMELFIVYLYNMRSQVTSSKF